MATSEVSGAMNASFAQSCAEHVAALRRQVSDALADLVHGDEPAELYGSVRYVLSASGKRIRPVLLLLAAETWGASLGRTLSAALAVEVFHSFTLVHDDIMDHAATRRGRPTVHVKWDVDTALLCGDYLLGLSYDLLGRIESPQLARITRSLSRTVARLCEGQSLDKGFEARSDVTHEDYFNMIDRKTGALLEASLETGGLIGGASDREILALRAAGTAIGRAYQVQDDLLDLVAGDPRWGKTIGGDLVEGKKTFLLLEALRSARGEERDWFKRIVTEGGLAADLVGEARRRMESLGILETARAAVLSHSAAAIQELRTLPRCRAAGCLEHIVLEMQAREH